MMTQALRPRAAVRRFGPEKERVLRKNDYKGGWKGMRHPEIIQRLHQELHELEREIIIWQHLHRDSDRLPEKLIAEAVDVGNFTMMILDNHSRTNKETE